MRIVSAIDPVLQQVALRSTNTLTASIYHACTQDDLCTRSHQIALKSKGKYHPKYHQLQSTLYRADI